ncbi:MAG: hypothetical protein HUJ26_23995 [Planctomycetaceae bacterium]|nr:hypothetical protein [Planctomycetaceae bacterium]
MLPGSTSQPQTDQTATECVHCGFSIDQAASFERCPRCWRPLPLESPTEGSASPQELIFAEAAPEESLDETPAWLIAVPGEEEVLTDEDPSRLKRWLAGYGASFLVHSILMIALALIVYQVQVFQWHDAIQSSMTDGVDVLGQSGGLELMKPVDFQIKTAHDPESLTNAAYQATNVPNAGQGGTATGSGDGGIGFFGTRAKGDSFAFVVDISGSMNGEFKAMDPQNAGATRIISRWDKAREELIAAIDSMTEDQSYCVVLYNNNHLPMIERGEAVGLRKASPANKRETKLWLERMSAYGGTNPQESLAFALELHPDVLYFLTDGAIPPDSRDVAAAFTDGKTVIHTTCIGYPQNDILQLIAADHRGQFRAVTPQGDSATPSGVSLILFVRRAGSQRQKTLRLEKDYERLVEWIEDPDIDFQQPNTHTLLLLHNGISSVPEFNVELLKFVRSLNTEGVQGFQRSLRGGLLGVEVPLDPERRLTEPAEIEAARKKLLRVNQILKTAVSESDYDSYEHHVRAIYLFGDVEAKAELTAALEVFDLYNGSQIQIIDGDQFVRENR